jgi:hypothetical protein
MNRVHEGLDLNSDNGLDQDLVMGLGQGTDFSPDFRAPVAQAIMAGNIAGDINLSLCTKERARAAALDPRIVQRLREVYVRVPEWELAFEKLRGRGAVALVGAPGNGREITAVNLLGELGMRPRRLLLDPDDPVGEISARPENGYVVDLSVLNGSDTEVGAAVDNCLQLLEQSPCRVVFLTDEQTARRADLEDRDLLVRIGPAPSGTVFVKELLYLSPHGDVEGWARHPRIDRILAEALPADAARLARLVHEIVRDLAHSPPDQQLDEVTGAYGSWRTELQEWDRRASDVENGEWTVRSAERRALILAVAAMEGASPQTILAAADLLLDTCGITPSPGSGLMGPSLEERLHQIGAVVENDQVCFQRHAYGPAVLDWVWTARPQIRDRLPVWIARTGLTLPSAQEASLSLLELALRKRDPNLVLGVASEWIGRGTRGLAVQMVEAAALSEEVGGPVRRTLYQWARRQSDTRLHLLVAEVCSGAMAEVFPDATLTRLRNLARHDSDLVRTAVVGAIGALGTRPALRRAVLRETARWASCEIPARVETGCRAFLALARARDAGGWTLLEHRPSPEDLYQLGRGWRSSLRLEQTQQESEDLALLWLDSTLSTPGSRWAVLQSLANACRSSIDIAGMTGLLSRWVTTTQAGPPADADEIQRELAALLRGRDGLDPLGAPSGPLYPPSGTEHRLETGPGLHAKENHEHDPA